MSEYVIPIGSLEEQALKRKERLKNLKRKLQEKSTATDSIDEKSNTTINDSIESSADNGNEETALQLKNDDVITEMSSQLESLKTPFVVEEIDIQNLAPRKPDWDLKRDVSKKLEILERKTQRAIAEIIRDRLRTNQDGQGVDLQAVNTLGYSSQNKDTKIVQQISD